MGTINIYNDETNRTYQINVDLVQSVLSTDTLDGLGGTPPYPDGSIDLFLRIKTNITDFNGDAFDTYAVRSLDDIAPGASPATNFDDLITGYINYFVTQAELGQSSTSSSSESTLSSQGYSSSSSSSSELYSASSLSSSSSIDSSSSSSSSI